MRQIKIAIAQTSIEQDIQANLQNMLRLIEACEPVDIIVFPEGMLSGYFPEDPDFLKNLSPNELQEAVQKLGEVSALRNIDLLFGTAYQKSGKWHNTALWLRGTTQHTLYSKCNLANLDRGLFEFGDILQPVDWQDAKIGIQVCREIKYPEQWLALKLQGAQVIFHLNNNQSGYFDWEFLLQARAHENQFYIVSVNPSHPNQRLFSYVLATNGHFMLKTSEPGLYYQTLDLSQVSTAYIDQRRTDLLQLVHVNKQRY